MVAVKKKHLFVLLHWEMVKKVVLMSQVIVYCVNHYSHVGITGHGAHSLAFQFSKHVPLFTTQNLKITIKFCKDVNVTFSLQHYV